MDNLSLSNFFLLYIATYLVYLSLCTERVSVNMSQVKWVIWLQCIGGLTYWPLGPTFFRIVYEAVRGWDKTHFRVDYAPVLQHII